MNITLANVGTVDDVATDDNEEEEVAVTLTDIETINANIVGDNVVKFEGGYLTTLNIEGDGNLKVSVDSPVTSVDASNATGDLNIDLTGTSADEIETVITGAGADTIEISADKSLANAVISGGEGEDILDLANDEEDKTVQYQMTDVETVSLSDVNGSLTFSGSKSSGITTINTSSTVGSGVAFVGMTESDMTINSNGETDEEGNISVDNTGATTLNYIADEASVESATTQTAEADFTFNESDSLTVNVGKYIDANSDITATNAASVTLNAEENSEYNGTLKVDEATSVTIDSKGTLGEIAKVDASKATTIDLTNGTTAGKITLATPELVNLNITSDSNFDILDNNEENSSGLSQVENANIVTTGTFTNNASMDDIYNLNVSGTGKAVFANLGTTEMEHDISITAQGLTNGFYTGNIATDDDSNNIYVDATQLEGD